MAWLLDPVPVAWGRDYLRSLGLDVDRPLVGVNLNNEPFMQREAPELLKHVARSLDQLIDQHGATAVFMCNDVNETPSADKAASALIRNAMRRPERAIIVPNVYWSPQQMLSLIGCCRVTLSTRYHFCLFSALQGVPFIALQRSDKVSDLCEDLQWTFGIPIEVVTTPRLVDLYARVATERRIWTGLLKYGAAEMRQRARMNQCALD
jgi:polysaccharide pyruvyl transferase WcaK-like protein